MTNQPSNTAEPALMTPEDVADFLRVKRNTVYRMLKCGELPSICIGGRRALRVRPADLTAYLERCAIPSFIAPAVAVQTEPAQD